MVEHNQQPVSFVIFGASGDLAHRKLIPAVFNLYRKGRLGDQFEVIGFAINPWSDDEFKASMREGVNSFATFKFTEEEWQKFSNHLTFLTGNFDSESDYQRLKDCLEDEEKRFAGQAAAGQTAPGRVYYLATPPSFIDPITQQLGKAGMLDEKQGWKRVVVEKPFGSSYETAHEINKKLHSVLKEEQIFRIDHYLGKETVQNLLVFRFANAIFTPAWNNEFVDHVQISVMEDVGVGHRGGYYDKAGVVRDMFQNHLMQLLTMMAIDPPDTLMHKDLHARKIEVMKAIRPITDEDVAQNTVRGQYKGYCEEQDVADGSQTPTYAAIRFFIDNKRWRGVPFYLRSGKSLGKKCTEIIIQFCCPPSIVYPMPPKEDVTPNVLAFCIQPDEGIYLRFEAKVPDTEAGMRSVEMEFHYDTSFGPSSIPEAYERLILEVVMGDHTLFVQDDSTEIAWKLIDPILKEWDGPKAPPLEEYDPGSDGPQGAQQLIKRDGREWMLTCMEHKVGEHHSTVSP